MYKLLRSLLVFGSIGLLLLGGTASYTRTLHAQTDERCFSETGYCINGRIREFWEQNDGLRVFGLPITEQREEIIEGRSLQVQWFERNRLELHPENPRPYDVQLGLLGVDALQQQGRDWFTFPKSTPQSGCRFFEQTGHNICGAILEHWQSKGIELDGVPGIVAGESLALFGLPLSDVQTETIEGQTLQVQWFERARFELHPENAPPYNVQLGLLGNEMVISSSNSTPDISSGVGQIAFESDRTGSMEVYVMNSDGSSQTRLTNNPMRADNSPVWSPDGNKIAFVFKDEYPGNRAYSCCGYLSFMNADGSDQMQMTEETIWDTGFSWSPDGARIALSLGRMYDLNTGSTEVRWLPDFPGRIEYPVWSPDGTKMLFSGRVEGNRQLYVVNTNNYSEPIPLTPDYSNATHSSWSSDGSKIVFEAFTGRWGIYVMNSDGSEQVQLTDEGRHPVWSPDGEKIAFVSGRNGNNQIYVMNPDGTEQINISRNPFNNWKPSWSPASVSPLPTQNRGAVPIPDPGLCTDVPDPMNATISPAKCVYQGDTVRINIVGFQPNEQFVFTVTAPDGQSQSSAQKGTVQATGELNDILYDTMPMQPGIWSVSFIGDSGHTATLWFKILLQ
jgi:Tol biopolymer transport system component